LISEKFQFLTFFSFGPSSDPDQNQKESPSEKPRKDYFLVTPLSGSITDDI